MPRLMAVSLTEKQVRNRTKTVTRRTGWLDLKPGTRLTLCPKVMGRRHGDYVEPLERIVDVEVISVRRERLTDITLADVLAEGFPEMTRAQFIRFFCDSHKGCTADVMVTRIEWRYLPRSRTPEVANPDGSRLMTVQRCCNGCGEPVGDVTIAEIDIAVDGGELPDVRMECRQCGPGTLLPEPEVSRG
jgi:hypothetical protein